MAVAPDRTPSASGLGTGPFGAALLKSTVRDGTSLRFDDAPGFLVAKVGVILLIPGLLLPGCSIRPAAVSNPGGGVPLRPYGDPARDGFRIQYPADWRRRSSPRERLLVQFETGPDHPGGPAVCGVGGARLPIPLPAGAIRVIGPLVAGPVSVAVEGLRPLRGEQARIGPHPAYRYEHTLSRSGGRLWVLQYLLVGGDRLYVLTCFSRRTDRAAYRDVFERILGSFRPTVASSSGTRSPRRPTTPFPSP